MSYFRKKTFSNLCGFYVFFEEEEKKNKILRLSCKKTVIVLFKTIFKPKKSSLIGKHFYTN